MHPSFDTLWHAPARVVANDSALLAGLPDAGVAYGIPVTAARRRQNGLRKLARCKPEGCWSMVRVYRLNAKGCAY